MRAIGSGIPVVHGWEDVNKGLGNRAIKAPLIPRYALRAGTGPARPRHP
jgi:hypothetical protein